MNMTSLTLTMEQDGERYHNFVTKKWHSKYSKFADLEFAEDCNELPPTNPDCSSWLEGS